MTAENDARSCLLIQLSNSPAFAPAGFGAASPPSRIAPPPVFFVEAPGAPVFLRSPRKSRGWSAARRIRSLIVPRFGEEARAPLGAPRRLASCGHLPPRHRPRVRAFRDDETYRQSPSASSSRRGRSAPRAEPRASRGRGYEPRARAPHRRGEGKPLAPAREAPMPHLRHRFLPDGPAVVTSRDDAPRQARRIGI